MMITIVIIAVEYLEIDKKTIQMALENIKNKAIGE